MKFLHLGDLHIGKRVNEFSMIDDQRAVLDELVGIAVDEGVDAVIIAGDFYDRAVPSEQAVGLAGDFLEELHATGLPVLMIPGNHDSAERLSFLSGIIGGDGIHIAGPYEGKVEQVVLEDEAGPVAVHLLPYVTPADARRAHPECEAHSFDEALRAIIERMDIDEGIRNVLVAHQFVLGGADPIRSDSEQASIGGLDEVSAGVFEAFDYVALGHLHAPQWIVRDKIRYCGSPLKYSFNEVDQRKCANIVELRPDGSVRLEQQPLHAPHDMAELRGSLPEVRAQAAERPELEDCYMRVVLTEPVSDAKAKLQDLFPLLMRVEFDYASEGGTGLARSASEVEKLQPGEVFAELFAETNGRDMSERESEAFDAVLAGMREGGVR